MTAAVLVLGVLALVESLLVLYLVKQLRAQQREEVKSMLDLMAQQDLERQKLLERIQRPERPPMPTRPAPKPLSPEQERELMERQANYGKIGTVES